MQWLTNLPMPIRENAHFMCCNTINEGLLSFILSNSLKSITVSSLRDLKVSITHLETFADGCSVRNLKRCFHEIRTFVDVILEKSTLNMIIEDSQAFRTKYQNINPTKLAVIYKKLQIDTSLKSKAISKLNQLTFHT